MAISLELKSFIHDALLPAIFKNLDRVFPEFEFSREGDEWVSGNTLKTDGTVGGTGVGKVICTQQYPCNLFDERIGAPVGFIDYKMDRSALSFIEAVKELAGQVGLIVPDRKMTDEDRRNFERYALQNKLAEAANAYFINNLFHHASDEGDRVRKYIVQRGYFRHLVRVDSETTNQKGMELGFIPSVDEMREHLRSKGFTFDVIDDLLLNKSGDGGGIGVNNAAIGHIHRLTLPWRDSSGTIRGFQFRNIDHKDGDKLAKYIYTSGKGWKKGLLFNLRRIRNGEELVLVEGPIDALYCTALGIKNVAALGSASLGDEQIQEMRKCGVKQITLCLDNDATGMSSTSKLAAELVEQGFKVFVASLPNGYKDPDELIRAKGKEAFEDTIRNAKLPYMYEVDLEIESAINLRQATGELTDKDREGYKDRILKAASHAIEPHYQNHIMKRIREDAPFLGITAASLEADFANVQAKLKGEREAETISRMLDNAKRKIEEGDSQGARDIADQIADIRSSSSKEEKLQKYLKKQTFDDFVSWFKDRPAAIDSGLLLKGKPLRLPGGALTIIAAPTSHGKTAMLMNLLLNVMHGTQKPVRLFSYEEHTNSLLMKTFNIHMSGSLKFRLSDNRYALTNLFSTGKLPDDEDGSERVLADAKRFMSEHVETDMLKIYSEPESAEDLIDIIKELHARENLGAVFIDYIQCLRLEKSNPRHSREQELGVICELLKSCAVSTGLPIILGAQFNREVESEEDLSYRYIRESGQIEHSANLIVGFWNRNHAQQGKTPTPELAAKILKARDYEVGGIITLDFNGNSGLITNKKAAEFAPRRG